MKKFIAVILVVCLSLGIIPNFGYADFSTTDLNVKVLKAKLQDGSDVSRILLKKLGADSDQLEDVSAEQFVRVLNLVTKIPDFCLKIDTDKLDLDIATKELLAKVKRSLSYISGPRREDVIKLNETLLLAAIYPEKAKEIAAKPVWDLNRSSETSSKTSSGSGLDLPAWKSRLKNSDEVANKIILKEMGIVSSDQIESITEQQLIQAMNKVLKNYNFYTKIDAEKLSLSPQAKDLLAKIKRDDFYRIRPKSEDIANLNLALLKAIYPEWFVDGGSSNSISMANTTNTGNVNISQSNLNAGSNGGFWQSKSKTKLKWGWVLTIVGIIGASYGLSSTTVRKSVSVPVNVSTSDVSFGNSINVYYEYNYGYLIKETITGTITNNGKYNLDKVVISVTEGGRANTTVYNISSGTTKGFTLVVNYPGSLVSWDATSVSSSQTETQFENQTEAKNSTIGTIGIGAAVVGISFLLSYAAAKTPLQKAKNLQLEPVMYAKGNNVYTGLRLRYNF